MTIGYMLLLLPGMRSSFGLKRFLCSFPWMVLIILESEIGRQEVEQNGQKVGWVVGKRKNDVNTKCSFINPSDIIEIMTFAHNPPPYGFKFSISPFTF